MTAGRSRAPRSTPASTPSSRATRSSGWSRIPGQWRDELDDWAAKHGDEVVLDFATNSIRRFGPAVDRFRAALITGSVTHDGDPHLARHLANVRLARTRGAADDERQPYTLAKAGPGRSIDAAIASVLAFEAMAGAPVEHVWEPMVQWR